MAKLVSFLFLAILQFVSFYSAASHLIGGEITARQLSTDQLSWRVCLTLYTDFTRKDSVLLDFGDGRTQYARYVDSLSQSMDEKTGQITWNSPGVANLYNITYEVVKWRKLPDRENDGNLVYKEIGSVMRDFQITVADINNQKPWL
jgi:hypothetical protein